MNMKIVIYSMMMLAAMLAISCTSYDDDDVNKCMDEGESIPSGMTSVILGDYTGVWSLLDNQGETLSPLPDDKDYHDRKVTVKVVPASQNDNVTMTVSSVPVWLINRILMSVNQPIPTIPGSGASDTGSVSFMADLSGLSSNKLVFDLVGRFSFSSSYFSSDGRIASGECTFLNSAQSLYTYDFGTIDLYLPVNTILLETPDDFVGSGVIPLKGGYSLVLHAERVKE